MAFGDQPIVRDTKLEKGAPDRLRASRRELGGGVLPIRIFDDSESYGFKGLKRVCRITNSAQIATDDPYFSGLIRVGLPGADHPSSNRGTASTLDGHNG